MFRALKTSEDTLALCRRIVRGYFKPLIILLILAFLAMPAQLFVDHISLLSIPLVLAAFWLMCSPVILLAWVFLRLHARRLKRDEAFMQATQRSHDLMEAARAEKQKLEDRRKELADRREAQRERSRPCGACLLQRAG